MLAPSIICRTCSTLSATTAVTPPRARASSEVMLITAPRTETPISLKPTDNKQRMVCLMDSLSPACMGLLRVVRPLVPHPMVRGHPSQPPNQPPNHLTRTKDSMHPSRSRRRRCPPQSLSPTPSLPRHPRHWHGAVSLILQATNKVLRPMLKERVNPPPLRSPVSLYTTRSDAPVLDYCLVRLLYSSSLSLSLYRRAFGLVSPTSSRTHPCYILRTYRLSLYVLAMCKPTVTVTATPSSVAMVEIPTLTPLTLGLWDFFYSSS